MRSNVAQLDLVNSITSFCIIIFILCAWFGIKYHIIIIYFYFVFIFFHFKCYDRKSIETATPLARSLECVVLKLGVLQHHILHFFNTLVLRYYYKKTTRFLQDVPPLRTISTPAFDFIIKNYTLPNICHNVLMDLSWHHHSYL